MKKPLVLMAGLLVSCVVGCNDQNSHNQGGPGVTHPTTSKMPTLGQKEDTFSLSMPTFSTKITQGESKTATIGIKRGKNFDQDVTLKFGDLPKGVTITPASPVIKHSDTEEKVTIAAAPDAAVGDFTISTKADPSHGAEATTEIKITVVKK
jgi:uncharacterized membrane protein